MKNFLVIGNPIDHSLSPKLHNYWIKNNNINAFYDKKKIEEKELKDIILKLKEEKIYGINVTVPFKNLVIPLLDKLSPEANQTKSVNTIYLQNGKTIGHNTDIAGFELAIRYTKYNVSKKTVLILGGGGVVSSIIFAIRKMGASNILLSNRTKKKAEDLKNFFPEINLVDWGENCNFDMIINATSLGLKDEDEINIDYKSFSPNKFFYDVIYNPKETNFLKKAKKYGHRTENGKMMFIYQAHQAFTIWHKVMPEINNEIKKLVD